MHAAPLEDADRVGMGFPGRPCIPVGGKAGSSSTGSAGNTDELLKSKTPTHRTSAGSCEMTAGTRGARYAISRKHPPGAVPCANEGIERWCVSLVVLLFVQHGVLLVYARGSSHEC
eukprot:1621097-Amphidinium_carterae.1